MGHSFVFSGGVFPISYPMTDPWDWYFYLHLVDFLMPNVGKYTIQSHGCVMGIKNGGGIFQFVMLVNSGVFQKKTCPSSPVSRRRLAMQLAWMHRFPRQRGPNGKREGAKRHRSEKKMVEIQPKVDVKHII